MIARTLAVVLLASTVLVAQPSQPPIPSAREDESSPPPEQSESIEQGAQDDRRGTAESPLIIQVWPTPEAQDAAQRDEEKADKQAAANWWNVALTGVLIAVALGTGIAVAYQAFIARKSLLAATSARLYIDGIDATNFLAGQEPVFFLRIANAGPVHAEKVAVFVEIEHAHGSTRPAQPNTIVVPANGACAYDFRGSFVLTSDLSELESWNLTIKGTVTLNDDEPIRFCYKYNHWDGERPSGVPLFVPCDYDRRRHVAIAVGSGNLSLSGSVAHVHIKKKDNQG